MGKGEIDPADGRITSGGVGVTLVAGVSSVGDIIGA